MKESGRSKHSPTAVKKRSSSGCLIIKKKVTDSGLDDPSSRNLFNPSKEKKRQRVVGSDSEYSDSSSDSIGRKADKFHNESPVYKGGYLEDREIETEKRASNGLDVFEFDEYDGFDDSMIRKDANDGRYRWKLPKQSANHIGSTSKFEMEDDESNLPLSAWSQKYRSTLNKSIRLQGKNGVLKVMVNKNKMGVSRKSYDDAEDEDQKEPNSGVLHKKRLHASEDTNKNKEANKSSLYLNSKHAGSSAASKKSKQRLRPHSKREVVKNEEAVTTVAENVTQVKVKESKVQRGTGTEKQILREKIKNMLLGAGWTIDYRPRRNRDYLDSVYISPGGTGYWSIIKAYDALQKEEEDNSKTGGSFTPLPEELLGKLTRQTQKKMERDMKKKRKNEGNDQKEVKFKCSSKLKKSKLKEESQDSGDVSSENSYDEMANYDRAAKTMVANNSHMNNGRSSKKVGRCTLLVRGFDKGLNSETDGFVPYSGKRTLLSWLIDSGVVQMSEHVEYMNRRKTRIMQKGWITKDGIHCGCCSKIVTVLKFEMHAGSKLHQPFTNMFLESGKSLLQCQVDAWNKQGELEQKGFYTVDVDGDDPNDDTCGLCGDGGDLICCDGCPSTFHQSCLDIQMLPQGDWHCPNCCCKYCKIASAKCTEVDCKTGTSISTCCFCQKKYHESCKPGTVKQTESNYMNLSFCQQKCHELYSHLQKLLGVKHELDSGFSWSLIHRSDLSIDASSEFSRRVELNSMVALAMSIMDECFLPFTDRRSETNLIRNVVFNCGSNLSRLNYSGFFTAILERGDEVLCAASIRIHGAQLAEMPFIGTRHIYRRQGMCRRLLSAIELFLSSLQVERLIIPAVAERMHTWTDVFGFHPLEESHKQEMKTLNMLVFPGTDMLQKPLVKQTNPNAMSEGNKVEVNKYNVISSHLKESCDKSATLDSGSQESNVPSDDGCSVAARKEILPNNSPVKDEKPSVILGNKSELVDGSSGGLNHDSGNDSSKPIDTDSHPPKVFPDTVVPSCDCFEPKHEMAGRESVSPIHSVSNPTIEETFVENGKGTIQLPTQVHDMVPSIDVQETDVQKSSTTNNMTDLNSLDAKASNHSLVSTVSSDSPCEHELHPCGLESQSLHVQTAERVGTSSSSSDACQLSRESANNSLEPEASNQPLKNIVSSDLPCERQFQSCSLDAQTTERVEKSSSDVSPMILEINNDSLEAEASKVALKNTISSDLPSEPDLKSCGIESHSSDTVEKRYFDISPVILETTNNTTDVNSVTETVEKSSSDFSPVILKTRENAVIDIIHLSEGGSGENELKVEENPTGNPGDSDA